MIDHDEQARTVTRRLLGVDSGRLRAGPARWNQYFYAGDPAGALGLPFEQVEVRLRCRRAPGLVRPAVGGRRAAARTPASPAQPPTRWAVLVHGRGATREEACGRCPCCSRLGMPALVISYRNDAEAPTQVAATTTWGQSEWLDVEAAVLHALQAGAQ